MSAPRRARASALLRRLPGPLALLALLAVLPAGALASATQETTFQDDDLLIFNTPAGMASTLALMRTEGAQRIRISLNWDDLAPAADSRLRPSFDASDPGSYPAGVWDRYDRLIATAQQLGMGVNVQLMGPAPLWATQPAPQAGIASTYAPSAPEFAQFVRAAATRWSGGYTVRASGGASVREPRVDYWSIWNEPNNQGNLTPQWTNDAAAPGGWIESSPQLYRQLVDAGYGALVATGHGGDLILIGEQAPAGVPSRGPISEITPMHFIRQLYCLDDGFAPLQGQAATDRGCPAQPAAFPAAHPGLFAASGFAAHPYQLSFAPDRRPANPDFATIGNLGSLSATLARIFALYGRNNAALPLFLTEFGYETDPPNPAGIKLSQQAAYLDEADYISYSNPSVRTLAQSPLNDPPMGNFGAIGTSLQTGLRYQDGTPKPAFNYFRLPIFLPAASIRRGQRLRVWGQLRSGAQRAAQLVAVEFARHGSRGPFRVFAHVRANPPEGFIDSRIRLKRSGRIRLALTDRTSGLTIYSRAVSVHVHAHRRRAIRRR